MNKKQFFTYHIIDSDVNLDKVEKLKKEANMEVRKTGVDSRSDVIHAMLTHQFLKDYKTCLHFSTKNNLHIFISHPTG